MSKKKEMSISSSKASIAAVSAQSAGKASIYGMLKQLYIAKTMTRISQNVFLLSLSAIMYLNALNN